MVEDTKESLFRAEVQNRVFKHQIQAIDREMERLEHQLSQPRNPSVISSLPNMGKVKRHYSFHHHICMPSRLNAE